LEKRLQHQPEVRKNYAELIKEYEELGLMKLVSGVGGVDGKKTFNLPHHPVFKHDSSTTRLRVVFDAYAKTTNGQSLNDRLLIGPTIQQDLFSILLRFRSYQIAFTADIGKMYRQIRVHTKDTGLQRILLRFSSDTPIQV
jgi:hypothetical protein